MQSYKIKADTTGSPLYATGCIAVGMRVCPPEYTRDVPKPTLLRERLLRTLHHCKLQMDSAKPKNNHILRSNQPDPLAFIYLLTSDIIIIA